MEGELRPSDPRRVGGWNLTHRLGAGGMGTVYLGSRGGDVAAVKVIAPGLAGDTSFRKRFRREIEICRRVSGAQVAELLDAGPDDPQPWLAVRYVPGPTLREAIQDHGPLTGDLLKGFAVAVAEALRQIHQSGVVHRDLKPSNVILTAETPVIIDFGIAAVSEATSLTNTGTVMGSAGWMSPEQILGRPSGTETDVFSWAAVVAYAATGRPPFGEGRPEALTYRVVHGDADLDGIDPTLRPLIERALSREPAERPSIGELLAQLAGSDDATQVATGIATAWTRAEATAIATPRTEVSAPDRGRPRRRPSMLTVVTALVIALMIAGVAIFAQRQDAKNNAEATQPLTIDQPPAPRRSPTSTSTTGMTSTTTTSTSTTTPPTTTTTPPPPPSVRDVDLQNRDYDIFCDGSGAVTTIPVRNGTWVSSEGPEYGVVDNFRVDYADVTGDGEEDAVVNMTCAVGAGSNSWGNTVVLSATEDGIRPVGQPITDRTIAIDGSLVGETPYWEEWDPMCCPSAVDQSTWVLRNGGWSQESSIRIPIENSYTLAVSGE